jgi:hypothetical protein
MAHYEDDKIDSEDEYRPMDEEDDMMGGEDFLDDFLDDEDNEEYEDGEFLSRHGFHETTDDWN